VIEYLYSVCWSLYPCGVIMTRSLIDRYFRTPK